MKCKVLLYGHIITLIFMLSVSSTMAQVCCVSDATSGYPYLDYWPDGSVNAWDFGALKSEWGNDCVVCRAPVPRTGQTTSYVTGDDGDLRMGIEWPEPRFTANVDNNGDGDCDDDGETCDGTVTDNLTGLIWLKNASCNYDTYTQPTNWFDAVSFCNGLASGYCGITDGSSAGDWRLPNRFELESLLDLQYILPALPNTAGTGQWIEGDPFNNVQIYDSYWTGSHYANYMAGSSWYTNIQLGDSTGDMKFNNHYVWPVRPDN